MATRIVLFDLLTALTDSWTVWNVTAGLEELGMRWRKTYLKWTYGCGQYKPYENLVEWSAKEVGLSADYVSKLKDNWHLIKPWPEAVEVLEKLKEHYKIGVVTNCSKELGHQAVRQVGVPLDVVVTSEEAGFYKPDPHTYQMALDLAKCSAEEAVFVAGSPFDLFGTTPLGITTFWHNRAGLTAPENLPKPRAELKTLDVLPALIEELNR